MLPNITFPMQEMLKAVLIVWKNIPLEIPYEVIEEFLTAIKSETQILGLQIWDAIILHGFLPTNQEFRLRFKQLLVDLLTIEDKRKVTRLCASLCGSLLLREADLDFEKRVCGALQKWYQKKKVDVFVDLLFEVSRRQPTVLVKFANINLSLLGTVYGTLKVISMESFLMRVLSLIKILIFSLDPMFRNLGHFVAVYGGPVERNRL